MVLLLACLQMTNIGKVVITEDSVNDLLLKTKAQSENLDYDKLKSDAEKIIADVKRKAEQIVVDPIDQSKYFDHKYKRFLLNNKFGGFTNDGIDTEKFINSFGIYEYHLNQGVDEKLGHDVPTQLYYINQLGKIFDWNFVMFADGSLKFTNVDLMCCDFIKKYQETNTIPNYKIAYDLLEYMLFKLIVATCTSKENAFKSEHIWINNGFKLATKNDVVMLTCLPDKLMKSFTIFIDELSKTSDCYIFNDISKLVRLNREHNEMELEPVLASAIRGMTPMFIYDYFNVVKSLYIFMALYSIYISKVEQKQIRYSVEDIHTIAVVCSIMYQNKRLFQHGIGRQLPTLRDRENNIIELDEQTQLYYLNHTMLGPQYLLLKNFEEAVCSLRM